MEGQDGDSDSVLYFVKNQMTRCVYIKSGKHCALPQLEFQRGLAGIEIRKVSPGLGFSALVTLYSRVTRRLYST